MLRFRQLRGAYASLDPAHLDRVDQLFASENLTQAILHAHLLLEQALTVRIQEKLARPEVLSSRQFAGFSFAQKIALYVGLYDPDARYVAMLRGFNKLRNTIAHQLIDEAAAVAECLPAAGSDDPMHAVVATFGHLALGELGAINGIERVQEPEE